MIRILLKTAIPWRRTHNPPGARLGFSLFDLEDELSAVFGRPVDLVRRNAVNKHIRQQVLHDARTLYAA